MDDTEFHAMIEEEAALLDGFGMHESATKMRACTTLRQATELHQEIEAVLRVAKTGARRKSNA